MGRELHASSHRVFIPGRQLGMPLTRSSCPWFPPVHISNEGNRMFRSPPFGLGPGAPSRQSCPNADTLVAPGGVCLIDRITSLSSTFSPLPMANPSARSLVRLVRASLRLVNDSVESLTTSKLLAVQYELRGALAIVDRKIKDNQRPSGRFFWNVRRA